MLGRSDAMLLEVVARELERVAVENTALAAPLGMAAGLIRTIERAEVSVGPGSDRRIDPSVLKTCLVRRGAIGEAAQVSLQRSALGFSKDTYLITVEDPPSGPRVVVVRRDLPGGPSRTTVLDEFPLVAAMFEAGLPVPEPLFVEADPAVLGQPFLLARGAPGQPDFASWETDPERRAASARELAGVLARLHSLPTEAVPIRRLAPGAAPSAELAAYFGEWRGFWRECGSDRFPEIAEAYDILEGQIPDLKRLAVVHSDVGFHNILVDDGRITAVLDWEFSHLGEPEEDLAYCRQAVSALLPWEAFLAEYAAAGGPAISPDRVRAYEIWRGVRNATCCALGQAAFEAGLNSDLRLAYAGRVILNMCIADVKHQLSAEK